MRRTGLLVAAFLCLAAPPAAADGPSAVLVECEREAAAFEARMETLPETRRMSMRFTLQAREADRRGYRRVSASGFDEWTTADPDVGRYLYTRHVEDLVGPARYRVRVDFRWQDAAGETVSRARRRSAACRQRDRRPDLEIEALDVEPAGEPGLARYVALVGNTGRGPAGEFTVRIGDEEVAVAGLAARAELVVEVAGPACEPGAPVTAEADPEDTVDERSERDNELTIACP